jgi:hypothetical protein
VSLSYITERDLAKVRAKPAEHLFGINTAKIEIHVFSEAKPERRIQITYRGQTYVASKSAYSNNDARSVSVSCIAEGPDLDAAALKMLEALGVFEKKDR